MQKTLIRNARMINEGEIRETDVLIAGERHDDKLGQGFAAGARC